MKLVLFILMFLAALPTFAYEEERVSRESLPPEVVPFIGKESRPVALESDDLNGDGLRDYVLVVERKADPSDMEDDSHERTLLILARQRGGALKDVKRNDKIVLCSTCGGVMGDPFMELKTGPKTFTVIHMGGSSERWSYEYTFNYSRRDNTWQLVRVEEQTFMAGKPDKIKSRTYTPPRHYGKIDIADFDPENWKARGAK